MYKHGSPPLWPSCLQAKIPLTAAVHTHGVCHKVIASNNTVLRNCTCTGLSCKVICTWIVLPSSSWEYTGHCCCFYCSEILWTKRNKSVLLQSARKKKNTKKHANFIHLEMVETHPYWSSVHNLLQTCTTENIFVHHKHFFSILISDPPQIKSTPSPNKAEIPSQFHCLTYD